MNILGSQKSFAERLGLVSREDGVSRLRLHLTIGRRLWIGSAVMVLLVALLGGFGYWTISGMLSSSERMAEVLEEANADQVEGELLATWLHDVQLAQAELNRINRSLMQEMMRNAPVLQGFEDGAANPIGELLQLQSLSGLAERFPHAATALERLETLNADILAASEEIRETWRPRHDGLAPALTELKRTIIYWNLKVANTIFIHSSMGELLYETFEETPLEEFYAGAIYGRYAEAFPELEENIANVRRTNEAPYEASEELYDLMLFGKWDEVRTYYRDHFPSAIKSIAVDIDRILSVENASLSAQSRAFQLLQEQLGVKVSEAAGLLRELQETIRAEHESRQTSMQTLAGEVISQSMTMTSALGRLRDLNLVIPVVLTMLLCVGGVLLNRSITRPIKSVVGNLSEIADGGGDLTRQLETRSRDEVGDLARSFNRFVLRQRDMVVRVRDVSLVLGRATEEIRTSTQEVGTGAEQQKEALSRSQEALAQIAADADGVAKTTSTLHDISRQTTSATMQLGATIEEISEQMQQLLAATEQVSSSNGQMAVSVKQIEGNLHVLSEDTRSTAKTAEVLSERVEEVEEHAEQTRRIGREANEDAARGLQAVESSVHGVEALQQIIQSACESMRQLGERSRAIGKILNVIDEISEQTRMLSLNATIIAAQAGAHGKGFSVVVEEVRELADRTAASTREVNDIIQGVQRATSEVENAMLEGQEKVRREVARSHEAREALVKISGSTGNTQEQMNAIVASTHDQAESLRSITRAVQNEQAMLEQIAAAMQQFGAGVARTAGSSESMKAIADRVSSSVTEQAAGSRHISENMESMRDMIKSVERATGDQSRHCHEVSLAVQEILDVAGVNASRTVELQRVMGELVGQAQTLESEVGTFKV